MWSNLIFLLNWIVPLDVIVGRFTKETSDGVESINNFGFETIWSVAPLSKIYGFVKTEFTEVLKFMRKHVAFA